MEWTALPYFKKFHYTIWIQVLGACIIGFVSIILLPFLTLQVHEQLHYGIVATSFIIGIQPFSEMVFTFLAGGWVDRLGRRPIILVSLFLQSIALAGIVLSEDLIGIAVFSMINGIGRALYIPAMRAQVADITSNEDQGEVFAILSTAGSIGAIGGPIAGAFLYEYHPKLIFFVCAVLVFLYLVICMKYIPETNSGVSSQKAEQPTFNWRDHKLLWSMMVCVMPISFFHAQLETNWIIYLKENVMNYLLIFSVLETVGMVTMILFEIVVVNKVKKFTLSKIVLVGYLFYGVAALGMSITLHLSSLVFFKIMFCLGAIITLNQLQASIGRLAPTAHRGRYFALFGLHWDISRSFGPFVGAWVMSQFGGGLLFIIIFLLLVAGGIQQSKLLRTSSNSGKGQVHPLSS